MADFEGYEVENKASECRAITDWNKLVAVATCRGRSHAHVGKPRDDSYFFDLGRSSVDAASAAPDFGWKVFAVADGAGSARFSRKGSEIACNTVVEGLSDLLTKEGVREAFDQNAGMFDKWKADFATKSLTPELEASFRDTLKIDAIIYTVVRDAHVKISEESKIKAKNIEEKITIRDYHTTLLFIAIKKFVFGYFYISFWIGDGGMAIIRPDNVKEAVRVLGEPDGGEYAGQTRFLTMVEEINQEKIARRTRCGFLDDFESIILATDGITDPFFPSEASVKDPEKWLHFWDTTLRIGDAENKGCPELFEAAADLKDESVLKGRADALGEWLGFWSKGNHDDRTILIVK